MYEEDEDDGIVVDEAINVEDGGDDIAVNVKDEGDEGIVPEGINVAEEGDEGTILESTNVEEEGDEDSQEHEENPEFYDSAYEQSEDEQCLLENDDKAFDNYVDHNAPDIG
ncbi:hypothetical protein L3X38_005426 [Prunus dulcis]|uniref:Uncharacterized protein n=1 Tax=Prunus dulcis TaxID=3755 RepID=A0AAD5F476_PRUDU|nr:hypothetical protein L3X38_005426 [Prunus dulcis]